MCIIATAYYVYTRDRAHNGVGRSLGGSRRLPVFKFPVRRFMTRGPTTILLYCVYINVGIYRRRSAPNRPILRRTQYCYTYIIFSIPVRSRRARVSRRSSIGYYNIGDLKSFETSTVGVFILVFHPGALRGLYPTLYAVITYVRFKNRSARLLSSLLLQSLLSRLSSVYRDYRHYEKKR